MVCKIKRAVVLEPGGSPPGFGEKSVFGSLVGYFLEVVIGKLKR